MADEQVQKQAGDIVKPANVRFRNIGRPGLNRWGGQINEEYQPELQGLRGVRTYTEMRNDNVVGAMLFAFSMLASQAPWRIEPYSEDNADLEQSNLLNAMLFRDAERSWQDVLSDVFTMLIFGWAFCETVYMRRSDGRIGWLKIELRSQESFSDWILAGDGAILGMEQQPLEEPGGIISIPMAKALLFRTTAERNNPEGRSILRHAYRPWYYKKRIEEIEAIGTERDLAGLPMIGVPPELLRPEATANDRQVAQYFMNMARNLRRDEQEGVVYPLSYDARGNKRYEITLLSTAGRRQLDPSAIVERKSREIAMCILADFILIGHEAVGSFALSSSKTKMFGIAVGGLLNRITETFNRDEMPRIYALNGWDQSRRASLVHGDIETPELGELAEYVSKLSGAGVDFSDDRAERYFRDVARIPQRQEEDEEEEEDL